MNKPDPTLDPAFRRAVAQRIALCESAGLGRPEDKFAMALEKLRAMPDEERHTSREAAYWLEILADYAPQEQFKAVIKEFGRCAAAHGFIPYPDSYADDGTPVYSIAGGVRHYGIHEAAAALAAYGLDLKASA